MRNILVVNPVGTDRWDKEDEEYLDRFAGKGTSLRSCKIITSDFGCSQRTVTPVIPSSQERARLILNMRQELD
jgi:hypothetical protein